MNKLIEPARFRNKNVIITGGLGFIGSSLAHRLVSYGAKVLLVDSLIPEYGGNSFNIKDIENEVKVNIADNEQETVTAALLEVLEYVD